MFLPQPRRCCQFLLQQPGPMAQLLLPQTRHCCPALSRAAASLGFLTLLLHLLCLAAAEGFGWLDGLAGPEGALDLAAVALPADLPLAAAAALDHLPAQVPVQVPAQVPAQPPPRLQALPHPLQCRSALFPA